MFLVRTPTPSPDGLASASLNSIVAFSSTDLWVVGTLLQDLSLAEHWDGTSWTVVDTPNPGKFSTILQAVDGVSTHDLWAVGHTQKSYYGKGSTVALHWDGTEWSTVSTPSPGKDDRLNAVEAVAPNDVWAVGSTADASGTPSTLIEHWDGTAWSIVPSPDLGAPGNWLAGVSATSADDVWAVGSGKGDGLIEHWDGMAWTVVSSPSLGKQAASCTRWWPSAPPTPGPWARDTPSREPTRPRSTGTGWPGRWSRSRT